MLKCAHCKFPGAPDSYNCTFPTMIDDWRAKWYQYSGEQTDPLFPFGFVQVTHYLGHPPVLTNQYVLG